jgi:hypothetical protein
VEYTGAVGTAPSLNSRHFDATPPSSARAFLWIGAPTVTGAIVMAMELTAFRLYAPYLETLFVYGAGCSVVMLALAAGIVRPYVPFYLTTVEFSPLVRSRAPDC